MADADADADADAEALRARGNVLYDDGRFEEARALYDDAIAALVAAPAPPARRAKLAQLYSNRAESYVQERSFALALQDAVRALEYDPTNEKAQLRRLVALENLERFETAFRLVERVLDERDARKTYPVLFEYAITARRRLRKNMQQDVVAAKKESHAVGRMVHDNQQLRINFGCLIPSQVALGEFFDVSVNIGNEFGLFRRDYLLENERIKLQCVLRNSDHSSSLRLAFRAASSAAAAATLDAAEHTKPVDGVVTLNDRGKALFQVAIVRASDADDDSSNATADHVDRQPNMAISVRVHDDSAARWNLLPIVSLPFTMTATRTPERLQTNDERMHDAAVSTLGVHCCRPVWLPTLGRELLLAESPGNLGIGGKLWDSCLVLTRYLSRHRRELQGKTVVELGSGLGLVGMFCALLGASHVALTDIDEVVPLLAYNVRLNFPEHASNSLAAVPHFWGTSVANLPVANPDVLVLSDVVYDPEGYTPLVASLNALATSPETTIFMAHRSRNPMEHHFFDMLAQTFEYEQVDWASEEGEAVQPADAEAGRAGKDERALQDVKIFRISRRA